VKRNIVWCLLGLVLMVSSAWSQAGKSGGPEQAVADLEHKWLQSQQTNNPDLIASYLADNALFTNGQGKLRSKAEMLKEEKGTKYTSVDYPDLKVTVFGNTAIATGGFKAKGTDPEGKPLDADQRFTDTWVKTPDGKWQCVASATSPLKM
jgi:uncharacterized protein (TIGR02246 family)